MNRITEQIKEALNRLTKEQRKIIYISALGLAFLILFFALVYHPQNKSFIRIKTKLSQTENQIAEIMKITAGRDLAQATRELKVRFTRISGMLPREDEQLIYILSEQARKFKIEVKNISAGRKEKLEAKIRGYDLEEVEINMDLACEFHALGEYLDSLQDEYPVLTRIKGLDIERRDEGQPRLDANLRLVGYLAKPNK